MNLYTSLVRLKQELNDGRLPPMTPVPSQSLQIIDPEFTIGYGALTEDAGRGLRCPVRGCGEYRHRLGEHIRRTHADIGGEKAVKRALSIPHSAKLVSAQYRALPRTQNFKSRQTPSPLSSDSIAELKAAGVYKRRRAEINRERSTVGYKNLRDRCIVQVTHKLIDAQHKIGRSPSCAEARVLLGEGVVSEIIRVFGTWSNAKAHCGLDVVRRKRNHIDVLPALSAYYDAHGRLPSINTVKNPRITPLLPSWNTIQRAMGAATWSEAMERVAAILDIHGGRYGLPERKTA